MDVPYEDDLDDRTVLTDDGWDVVLLFRDGLLGESAVALWYCCWFLFKPVALGMTTRSLSEGIVRDAPSSRTNSGSSRWILP